VVMRVDRVGADTRYQAIVALMRDALSQRPAMARRADAWAGPFLWAVLLLALGAGAVWYQIDASRAVWVAVSVLIVTCPCALSLAGPSALVAAAGALARHGVMLQRLDALEPLARMSRLFMDKTGTLTEDRPVWVATASLSGEEPAAQRVQAAQALARWSTHPLSQALAGEGPINLPGGQWSEVNERPGCGLQGQDAQGQVWRLINLPRWTSAWPVPRSASGRWVGCSCDSSLRSVCVKVPGPRWRPCARMG
jgi:Cu2+-exporting ATPase